MTQFAQRWMSKQRNIHIADAEALASYLSHNAVTWVWNAAFILQPPVKRLDCASPLCPLPAALFLPPLPGYEAWFLSIQTFWTRLRFTTKTSVIPHSQIRIATNRESRKSSLLRNCGTSVGNAHAAKFKVFQPASHRKTYLDKELAHQGRTTDDGKAGEEAH